jgi:hypothetical protein
MTPVREPRIAVISKRAAFGRRVLFLETPRAKSGHFAQTMAVFNFSPRRVSMTTLCHGAANLLDKTLFVFAA